jgi:dipeptide transport system permease protein
MLFRIIGQRLLSTIPTLLGVSVLAFALIRLVPGDPVLLMLGERGGSPEIVQEMRARLGLDRPLLDQYWHFVSRAARGDLGESIISKRSVWEEFRDRFPATLELSAVALFWAVLVGVPLGIAAAIFRGRWIDHLSMTLTLIGYSMPIFWWGLILILTFSIALGWTPVAGRIAVIYDIEPKTGLMLIDVWLSGAGWPAFKEVLRHLALPALALGTVPLAAIARMTRSAMLDVLREDYMRTARAKGLSSRDVIFKHGLKNALVPIITIIGLMGSSLLTGAILTETIFAWPGIGKWMVQSVSARDYPVIQGGLLLIFTVVLIVNLLIDILAIVVNPFVRSAHES